MGAQANEMQQKMLTLMEAGASSNGQVAIGTAGRTATLVKNIDDTLNVMSQCNKELSDLKKRKKTIMDNMKLRLIEDKIKKKCRLIATLEDALDQQQNELSASTKQLSTQSNDVDDDDDMIFNDDSSDDEDE